MYVNSRVFLTVDAVLFGEGAFILFYFFNLSIVGIRYYISFRYTVQGFDIYIHTM